MTYSFENAEKIKKHYEWLIGKPLTDKTIITHIIVTPSDYKKRNKFLLEYKKSLNNDDALTRSGFIGGNVGVEVVSNPASEDSEIKGIYNYLKEYKGDTKFIDDLIN